MTNRPANADVPSARKVRKNRLGKLVTRARLSRGLTTKEAAARIGISRGKLSHIELGREKLNIRHAWRLCMVLHILPADLLKAATMPR